MTGRANHIDSSVQIAPPRIADDAGVPLTVHHLAFVRLDARSVADWRARRAPLGMRPATFREFCTTLFGALQDDGFLEREVDVRLKGSASIIYSGPHKELPTERSEWRAEFHRAHKRNPSLAEEGDIAEAFRQLHFRGPLPFRRPFDSMFYLRMCPWKSDYDLQISSHKIEQACIASPIRDPHDDFTVYDAKYSFIYDSITGKVLHHVFHWSHQWQLRLGRPVSVKVFGKSGPPNITAVDGELSSHFRSHDWMIRTPHPLED